MHCYHKYYVRPHYMNLEMTHVCKHARKTTTINDTSKPNQWNINHMAVKTSACKTKYIWGLNKYPKKLKNLNEWCKVTHLTVWQILQGRKYYSMGNMVYKF
jgi:hypothetical protein